MTTLSALKCSRWSIYRALKHGSFYGSPIMRIAAHQEEGE